jgi:hypothetical protein
MFRKIPYTDFAQCLNEMFIGNDLIDCGLVVSVKNRVFLVTVDPGGLYPLQVSHFYGFKHPGVLHYLACVGHLKLS